MATIRRVLAVLVLLGLLTAALTPSAAAAPWDERPDDAPPDDVPGDPPEDPGPDPVGSDGTLSVDDPPPCRPGC